MPGEVVTRTTLWEHVWESHSVPDSNVVDVYVRYLRNKLGRDPDLIQTIRGGGYVLEVPGAGGRAREMAAATTFRGRLALAMTALAVGVLAVASVAIYAGVGTCCARTSTTRSWRSRAPRWRRRSTRREGRSTCTRRAGRRSSFPGSGYEKSAEIQDGVGRMVPAPGTWPKGAVSRPTPPCWRVRSAAPPCSGIPNGRARRTG